MISGHLTIIFSHFIEGYLIPFTRYITGENVPCLSPQNLVFFKQRFSLTNFKGEKVRVWLANSFQYYPVSRGYIFAVWAVMRKVAGYFSHDSSHSENVASARRVFQYWHRTIFSICFYLKRLRIWFRIRLPCSSTFQDIWFVWENLTHC